MKWLYTNNLYIFFLHWFEILIVWKISSVSSQFLICFVFYLGDICSSLNGISPCHNHKSLALQPSWVEERSWRWNSQYNHIFRAWSVQELCGILAKLFSIVCFSGEICFFYKIIYLKNFIAYFQGLYTSSEIQRLYKDCQGPHFKFQGPNKLTFITGSKKLWKYFIMHKSSVV